MVTLLLFGQTLKDVVGASEVEVEIAERTTIKQLIESHDLFLIDDDAVRVFQDRFERRGIVGDLRGIALSLNEIIHHAAFQRSRPIERKDRYHIFKVFRHDTDEEIAHAGTFQLEDARRAPG